MMDFERAEELYDAVADRLAPVLRAMNGDDGVSSPNDLVMHLSPSELFEALHAAELLNLGPEFDKLRREVNTQEPCDTCAGYGCAECRDLEPVEHGLNIASGSHLCKCGTYGCPESALPVRRRLPACPEHGPLIDCEEDCEGRKDQAALTTGSLPDGDRS